MPRVILFPPADTFPPPDDARLAQAWAAFAAADAAQSAPAGLESRVLRVAPQAFAERRRADTDRRRRQRLAGMTTIAASLVAAMGWCLTPRAAPITPQIEARDAIPSAARADTPGAPAGTRRARQSSAAIPMTNVEAARVLPNGPRLPLAARPLLEVADVGLVRPATLPRAKSFSAPPVVYPASPARSAVSAPPPPYPDATIRTPLPLGATPAAAMAPAPDAWSSRGFQGIFDPAGGRLPAVPAPAHRLDQATPIPPLPADPVPPTK